MRRVVLITLMLLVAATSVAAKDWRGILPMHSTRADVEAILGPPPPPPANRAYSLHKGRSIYSLDEGEIYVVYADEDFAGKCLSTIRAGTVLKILVTPTDELPLASLNIDVKQFKKFDASKPAGHGYEGFINDQEGFVLRVFKGNVQQIVYMASALDRARCPSYHEGSEDLVLINLTPACSLTSRFDEYGDIRFSDEKARLDNFAIQLLNEKDTVGYIIVYAGQKATFAEAQLRANRAQEYLVGVRNISPERVKAIDGGYRIDLAVSLYILPADSEPPPLMPMLDPSQVEIVSEKKRRSPKRK